MYGATIKKVNELSVSIQGENLLFNVGIASSLRRSVSIYMFHILALRNIYTYVANQQIHSDKILTFTNIFRSNIIY